MEVITYFTKRKNGTSLCRQGIAHFGKLYSANLIILAIKYSCVAKGVLQYTPVTLLPSRPVKVNLIPNHSLLQYDCPSISALPTLPYRPSNLLTIE